jgi:hypothetical protein
MSAIRAFRLTKCGSLHATLRVLVQSGSSPRLAKYPQPLPSMPNASTCLIERGICTQSTASREPNCGRPRLPALLVYSTILHVPHLHFRGIFLSSTPRGAMAAVAICWRIKPAQAHWSGRLCSPPVHLPSSPSRQLSAAAWRISAWHPMRRVLQSSLATLAAVFAAA